VLSALLDGPARWCGDRPAIVLGDHTLHTWSTFAEAVARRGAGLRSLGVAPGDRVLLYAANCPAYLEVLFSIWHAGAVAVPVNSKLHPREAADLVESSRASLCFGGTDLAEQLDAHLAEPSRVIALGHADDVALTRAEPMPPVERSPEDDAWIFFTSGTTGRAKGARLTHGNLLAMTAAYYADVDALGPRDSLLHLASLSHASGLFSLAFVGRGASQVLPESGRFDPAELLSLVAARERSTFFVPPTLLRRLCDDQTEAAPGRIGRLLVGAAPVSPEDLRRGVAAFGPCIWTGYGQGETPLTITALGADAVADAVDADDEARLASVGVARFATRVQVIDDDNRTLPSGEIGEVIVAGPTVMADYLDLPEETALTLRGGWLHTGDLGRFDEQGYLTLVDRAKDVVITGGYNVYPSEVEHVLLGDPAVAEAAVVGRPDPEWGEAVVAYVVPRAGAEIDPGSLDARCLDAIARYKRPKEYRVLDELPRNAAGKILKSELRAMESRAEQHVAR
jgi:acyl-CoA synthetase (AMP-forming)/AMP-acid ligase II